MFIIFLMAGVAICGCALKNVIDMTLLTFNISMFTFEFEIGKVMVKAGGFPACGCVASRAVVTELAFMRIIFLMAGETILRRGLQILDSTRIQMTLRTSYTYMPAE